MKKHRFNILPDASEEDFQSIVEDIRANGYDERQPIMLYEGDILDGWQRYRACNLIGVTPCYTTFPGDDNAAMDHVIRMARRRNLTSSQRAMFATDAQEIIQYIAQSQPKGGRPNEDEKPETKLSPVSKDERSTAHKVAEIYGTSQTYFKEAKKIREAAPELAEQVKAGQMTLQDAKRAVRAIPTDPWTDDEKARRQQVENGQTVVANQHRDKNLIQWAEQNGMAVRIDRGSDFGNPFLMDADGTRDEVCDAYRDHYLPFKPSIQKKLPSLRGKVLLCYCYPLRCHGDTLKEECSKELVTPALAQFFKEPDKLPKANGRFSPPLLSEVTAYMTEIGIPHLADKWHDYYSSNGWKVGKNAMKDWKASCRTWRDNHKQNPLPAPPKKDERDMTLEDRRERIHGWLQPGGLTNG